MSLISLKNNKKKKKIKMSSATVTVVISTLINTALWVKFSADDILKYFSYFPQKTGYDISCKLSPKETICMKCQILFSEKNKKNIINLSSAKNAQRVVKVKS